MKTDFKKMEDEMDLLASNMDSITSFSEQISSTLQVSVLQSLVFKKFRVIYRSNFDKTEGVR